MKKCVVFLLLTVLLLCAVATALAGTYYVYTQNGKGLNLRSPKDNKVIAVIPYGTRLETDDNLSTETSAYVTYAGKSGYAKWEFLIKDPPPAKGSNGKAPTITQPPAAQTLPMDGEGEITIEAIGASISYVFYGGYYSAVSYDIPQTLEIKADRKPEYWVINGVRYDFEDTVPDSFILSGARSSMTIEAVPKNSGSATLLSENDIQAMRTGETLIVDTIHAKLCHVRAKGSGAGGWITEFDFTDDYINRATNSWERGGQVTCRVRADIPNGKKISYWKFNEAKLDFNTNVTQFLVRTLNASMTYEPIFDGKIENDTETSAQVTKRVTREPSGVYTRITPTPTMKNIGGVITRVTPTPTAHISRPPSTTSTRITPTPTLKMGNIGDLISRITPTPSPKRIGTIYVTPTPATLQRPSRPVANVTTYTVSCSNCTFSGGGYTNATSGSVAAGTTITVTARGTVSAWYINGAHKMLSRGGPADTRTSFTMTVETNTNLSCVLQ